MGDAGGVVSCALLDPSPLPTPAALSALKQAHCGPPASLLNSGSSLCRVEAAAAPSVCTTASRQHQAKLLKQINALHTKEDVLAYVSNNHFLLDSINLVTCVYRLARIYTNLPDQKAAWKAQLLTHESFATLLGALHAQLCEAQAVVSAQQATELPTGLNARCLANLVWSLVKLEAACEEGHPLALQVVAAASPLVMVYLEDCSGQGLANLLWSYAKIPGAYPHMISAILLRMVEVMRDPALASTMDAQALSNSIWVVAHVRSEPKPSVYDELEACPGWQGAVTLFLLLVAERVQAMLGALLQHPHEPRAAPQVVDHENSFSCQAVVNIVWSFSTILGSACGLQAPMRPLFLLVRQVMIGKLRASIGGLHLHMPWVYALSGNLNEQSLAHLVAAFDAAGLLNAELLQAVFDVATLHLNRCLAHVGSGGPHGFAASVPTVFAAPPLPFRAHELCTLLRACHTRLAEPWTFLAALNRLLVQNPLAVSNWNHNDAAELARAMQLLRSHAAVEAVQQVPTPTPATTYVLQPQPQQILQQQQQQIRQPQQLFTTTTTAISWPQPPTAPTTYIPVTQPLTTITTANGQVAYIDPQAMRSAGSPAMGPGQHPGSPAAALLMQYGAGMGLPPTATTHRPRRMLLSSSRAKPAPPSRESALGLRIQQLLRAQQQAAVVASAADATLAPSDATHAAYLHPAYSAPNMPVGGPPQELATSLSSVSAVSLQQAAASPIEDLLATMPAALNFTTSLGDTSLQLHELREAHDRHLFSSSDIPLYATLPPAGAQTDARSGPALAAALSGSVAAVSGGAAAAGFTGAAALLSGAGLDSPSGFCTLGAEAAHGKPLMASAPAAGPMRFRWQQL